VSRSHGSTKSAVINFLQAASGFLAFLAALTRTRGLHGPTDQIDLHRAPADRARRVRRVDVPGGGADGRHRRIDAAQHGLMLDGGESTDVEQSAMHEYLDLLGEITGGS
jgi:hypothetical protein